MPRVQKAFDSVEHKDLFTELRKVGINEKPAIGRHLDPIQMPQPKFILGMTSQRQSRWKEVLDRETQS